MQSDIRTEWTQSNTPGATSVVTNSVNCHLAILIYEIRLHVQTCEGGSSKSSVAIEVENCDKDHDSSEDAILEVSIFDE